MYTWRNLLESETFVNICNEAGFDPEIIARDGDLHVDLFNTTWIWELFDPCIEDPNELAFKAFERAKTDPRLLVYLRGRFGLPAFV